MPMKEWFPHDYHASRDVKVMRLIREGGAAAYGMYWHVVEMLHYTPNAVLADVLDSLQVVLRVTYGEASECMKLMIKLDLFSCDEYETITCSRIERNLQVRNEVSTKRKEAASKRWNANAMQVQCKSNANAMLLQDKTIQDKIEDTKDVRTEVRRARPSSFDELQTYFAELGMPMAEAQRFMDYYTANGWKVGRNAMKDWKAASRNWRKGYTEKQTKQGDTSARTQPTGLPAHVIEIANRPKLSQSAVDALKQVYLSKVSPDE